MAQNLVTFRGRVEHMTDAQLSIDAIHELTDDASIAILTRAADRLLVEASEQSRRDAG